MIDLSSILPLLRMVSHSTLFQTFRANRRHVTKHLIASMMSFGSNIIRFFRLPFWKCKENPVWCNNKVKRQSSFSGNGVAILEFRSSTSCNGIIRWPFCFSSLIFVWSAIHELGIGSPKFGYVSPISIIILRRVLRDSFERSRAFMKRSSRTISWPDWTRDENLLQIASLILVTFLCA